MMDISILFGHQKQQLVSREHEKRIDWGRTKESGSFPAERLTHPVFGDRARVNSSPGRTSGKESRAQQERVGRPREKERKEGEQNAPTDPTSSTRFTLLHAISDFRLSLCNCFLFPVRFLSPLLFSSCSHQSEQCPLKESSSSTAEKRQSHNRHTYTHAFPARREHEKAGRAHGSPRLSVSL